MRSRGQELKAQKIIIKTKIDSLTERKPKKEPGQQNFIVDSATGQKVIIDSSTDPSRSKSNKFATSKERRLRHFEKCVMKLRAKKEKERVLMEYNKKVAKLEEIQ